MKENDPAARERVRKLKEMSYAAYLQTTHWRIKRGQALRAANHRCQLCNSSTSLNVHHRTYERRGEELLSDLTVLCRHCHRTFHRKLQLHQANKARPV